MLTRDLLRFDVRSGVIRPRFVDAENRLWLEFAENLIHLYEAAIGQSEEELQEEIRPLLAASRSPLIAKGLNKLLLDRCRFHQTGPEHSERRLTILESAARYLAQPHLGDLEAFRQTVAADFGEPPDALASQLYNDLPFRQPLLSFDSKSPTWLLHRYNMAQSQGLLLWAAAVTITLGDGDPGHRRIFFRHLRFFQLLATIDNPGPPLRLRVDGPLSVLQQSNKYGLQLANLLPVLAGMTTWKLEATVEIQGAARLTLDHTDGLHTHYTRLSAYRPDSLTLFARELTEKLPHWTLLEDSPLVALDKQIFIMPDMTLQHDSGQTVHLELFHPWHGTPLQQRIALLDRKPPPCPLIVGVERGLLKESAVKNQLEASPWFQAHGFYYLEFPPVSRLGKLLNGLLASPPAEKKRRGQPVDPP